MLKEYSEKNLSEMETKKLGGLYMDIFQSIQEMYESLASRTLVSLRQEDELPKFESQLEMITTALKLRDFKERLGIMRTIKGILGRVKNKNDRQEYIAREMLHHFCSNILD